MRTDYAGVVGGMCTLQNVGDKFFGKKRFLSIEHESKSVQIKNWTQSRKLHICILSLAFWNSFAM